MTEIFSLDLSLSSTGYCKCAAEEEEFRITDLGSIGTKLRTEHTKGGIKIVDHVFPVPERIHIINTYLAEKGLYSKKDTVLVGIENYSMGSRGSAVHMLAELQGVIRYGLWRNGINKLLVAPQTIKAHAVKGSETKGMIAMHARINYGAAILMWGKELKGDDEADALVLCELTWLFYRWSRGLPIKNFNPDKKLKKRLDDLKVKFGEIE